MQLHKEKAHVFILQLSFQIQKSWLPNGVFNYSLETPNKHNLAKQPTDMLPGLFKADSFFTQPCVSWCCTHLRQAQQTWGTFAWMSLQVLKNTAVDWEVHRNTRTDIVKQDGEKKSFSILGLSVCTNCCRLSYVGSFMGFVFVSLAVQVQVKRWIYIMYPLCFGNYAQCADKVPFVKQPLDICAVKTVCN